MGNSFRRLLSVLTYFCMVYGILLGMIMTFGLKKQVITTQTANRSTKNITKFTEEATRNLESNGIFVSSIKPYDVVSSPLAVSGWVARSTFPNEKFSAILVDNNGEILAVAEVNSQNNGNVANFDTKLEFGTATNEKGNIFFEDVQESTEGATEIVSYRMPVKFAQAQTPSTSEEEAYIQNELDEPTVAGYETQYWGQKK